MYHSGGNIAAAWAALKALGQDGYKARARELMDTTDKMKAGIKKIRVKYGQLKVLVNITVI